MRYHLTPVTMAIIKMSTSDKCWREYRENATLAHFDGDVSRSTHCGKHYGQSIIVQILIKELQTELPYDPTTPLLGINAEKQNKTKALKQKDTYTSMSIEALLTLAKMLKLARGTSADKCKKKM